SNKPLLKWTRNWADCDEGSGGAHLSPKPGGQRSDGRPPPRPMPTSCSSWPTAANGSCHRREGLHWRRQRERTAREDKGEPPTCLAAKWLDIFPQKALYTESHPQVGSLSHEKSGHPSPPLNHRKSDSYATPAAERRSAKAGISDLEGGGPSPGCRPQTFPVRPPRRDSNPDRLPPWATRQRTLRIDLEHD